MLSLYDNCETARRSGIHLSAEHMQDQITLSLQRHGHSHLLEQRRRYWSHIDPEQYGAGTSTGDGTSFGAGTSTGAGTSFGEYAEEFNIPFSAPEQSQETQSTPVQHYRRRRRRRDGERLQQIDES